MNNMNKEVWVLNSSLVNINPVIGFSREQAKQLVQDFMKEQYDFIPRETIEESDNFYGNDEFYAVRYVSPLADLMD